MVVLGLMGLALGLGMSEDRAHAQSVVADPPILLRLGGLARIHLPQSTVVEVPAGSEIGAGGDVPLRYELESRVVHVPEPCIEATLFSNGFEAP